MNPFVKWYLCLLTIALHSALGLRKTTSDERDFALATLLAVGCTNDSQLPQLILAESENGGANWIAPSIIDAPEYGCLNSVTIIANDQTNVAIASGQDYSDPYSPLVIQKRGSGNWTRVPLSGVEPYGYFMSASCAATGSTDICIAAGYYFRNVPVLAQSINGNWSLANMPEKNIQELIASSCVTSNSTDIHCFAVGSGMNSGIILHSTNGGLWELAFTASGGHFDRISCFTNSNTGFACVVAGSPFAETMDGVQWTAISVPGDYFFRAVSCVSMDNNNCVAVGYTELQGLIMQRMNGTWARQVFPIIANTSLNGVSCINDGLQDGLCVAVGGGVILKQPEPIIGLWNGSWSFTNPTSSGSLYTVSCSAESNSTKCLAGG
ncbi:MAG: BNR/Asp-box repeat protein, partial [Gammaproteobacteria bacterium]|nr:BNR/Asp-box repeat protein [Gammaproteobacteria bacterium]